MSELIPNSDATCMADTPKACDSAFLDLLRMHLIPGIGPRTSQALLDYFGSPQAVLRASLAQLQEVAGVGPKLTNAIAAVTLGRDAEQELAECERLSVRLLQRGSDEYPRPLERICDPPLLLYCRGDWRPQDELAVAIVGSRKCTLYGKQQAERIARALAQAGVTIISGLARGIDAAAHQGAISVDGRTLAVMGTGLANIYPPEHRELAEQVISHGALLTEFKLSQPPQSGLFPQRNRIISGLSLAVLVVEAGRSSGALHTARHAMEQGREVLALPGRIDSLASEGCHDLIRDGATLIRHVDDVMAAIGPLFQPVNASLPRALNDDSPVELLDHTHAASRRDLTVHSLRELSLNDQERQVLNLITAEPTHQDQIIANSQFEPPRVLSTLTVLEMKRLIRRQPGGYFVRAPW